MNDNKMAAKMAADCPFALVDTLILLFITLYARSSVCLFSNECVPVKERILHTGVSYHRTYKKK